MILDTGSLKTTEYYVINERDWEDTVRYYYGDEAKDYSFCRDIEANNDSVYKFTTVPIRKNKPIEHPNFKDYSFITSDIFEHMASEGAIPHGNYLVNLCW